MRSYNWWNSFAFVLSMLNVRMFDVAVMVVFGFLGYFLRKLDIPCAPMALGIILGSMADTNFRRAVLAGKYSLAPFFTRLISAGLVIALVLMITWPLIRKVRERKQGSAEDTVEKT